MKTGTNKGLFQGKFWIIYIYLIYPIKFFNLPATKKCAKTVTRERNNTRVNIQFKGHLVSFGYSERIYALCGSEFF